MQVASGQVKVLHTAHLVLVALCTVQNAKQIC